MCLFFVKLTENYRETDVVMETLGSSLVAVSKRWFPEIRTAESLYPLLIGTSCFWFLPRNGNLNSSPFGLVSTLLNVSLKEGFLFTHVGGQHIWALRKRHQSLLGYHTPLGLWCQLERWASAESACLGAMLS